MSNRIRRRRTWLAPILALGWFVFVREPAEAQILLSAPNAQGFGQVAVNGLASVSQPLGYTFSGSTFPSFSLAYSSEYNLGSPQCTSSGGVTCILTVSFQPHWPGLRRNAILVKDTSGNVIATTFLYGTGLGPQVALYPGVISTVASSLAYPQGIAIDNLGNLYIADSVNQMIRKVSGGAMTMVAGTGTPVAVALDGAGNLYIADHDNNVIRKLDAFSHQMTIAVGGGILNGPGDIAVDGAGNLYIADSFNGLIRKLDGASGKITVVAGGGNGGADGVGNGGPAINARLDNPSGVAVDPAGNLYIADAGHSMIRRVDASSGIITAVAGNGTYGNTGDGGAATNAQLAKPVCVRLDAAGNLYIADQGSNVIRRVNAQSGVITMIAGNSTSGYSGDGGIAIGAALYAPSGLALDTSGSIYIADSANNAVRKISSASGFSFSNTITGEASQTQTLTVLNTGNQALNFTALTISPNFTQQSVGAANCSPGTVLAAGGACSVALAFTPAASGNLSGALFLADNSLNAAATQSLALSGTGLAGARPQVSVSASTLTFPMQAVGISSGAQTVTLSNTGSAVLNVSSIQLGGANAADFSMSSNCRSAVAAQANCSISIAFTPLAGGVRSASLIIGDNLASSPQTVMISGTGVPASIAAGSLSLAQGASVNLGYASLVMQSDGNLVLYRTDGVPLWSTGTSGQNCGANQCSAVFQSDGNFVVYKAGNPLWSSGTSGHSGAQLVFSAQTPQLEIVSNQSILWANQPRFAAGAFTLPQGAFLNLGYGSLVMQSDGNLVLYQSGAPHWSTGTSGQNCGANQCFAVFQSDGNLVVYNAVKPLWASGTSGTPGAQLVFSAQTPQLEIVSGQAILWVNQPRFNAGAFTLAQGMSIGFGGLSLVMQSDGNLVLYGSGGVPLWSTGTSGQNCGVNQCAVVFQGDGNLVVYNAARPLWTSGTSGNPGAQLVLSAQTPQLEIVSNQSILWTNQPSFVAGAFTLPQGACLNLGYESLMMQGDGNLVLYRSDGLPLWSTGTSGQNCGANQCFAAFQGDGNFVVYNAGKPLWNSGTPGGPRAQLVFSAQSPRIKIMQSQGIILWAN